MTTLVQARTELQARGYARFTSGRLTTWCADVHATLQDVNRPGATGIARGTAPNTGGSMQAKRTCACGCGGETRIARYPSQQGRFVKGHNRRKPIPDYEIRDCGYKTPCWVWLRGLNENGYGTTFGGSAHVALYRSHEGPVPDGLELDHLCRNRACCNPEHLEAVTHAENCRRGSKAKLDWDAVHEIRASRETHTDLGRRYGVSATSIMRVRKGETWREDAA